MRVVLVFVALLLALSAVLARSTHAQGSWMEVSKLDTLTIWKNRSSGSCLATGLYGNALLLRKEDCE